MKSFYAGYRAISDYLRSHPKQDNSGQRYPATMYVEETLHLLSLLNDSEDITLIPYLHVGEMALCAHDWVGYTFEAFDDGTFPLTNGRVIVGGFADADIQEKYSSIVVTYAMNLPASEADYISKSLDLLETGGTLIALVTEPIVLGPKYRELRRRILRDYSLDAVIPVQRIQEHADCAGWVLVIRNAPQSASIYMTLGGTIARKVYENYMHRTNGYMISVSEIRDRIDAQFYDPRYKKIRDIVHWRDTVKLYEIADIFDGISQLFFVNNYPEFGDSYAITPEDIHDGKVSCDNGLYIHEYELYAVYPQGYEERILRKGDILISHKDDIRWGIYSGDTMDTLAVGEIIVIRPHEDAREWLDAFVHTDTGINYLESQLQLFSNGRSPKSLSALHLREMSVPSIKSMRLAERIREGVDLETRAEKMFSEYGWNVVKGFPGIYGKYDLALFHNNVLRAVVEVRLQAEQEVRRNREYIRRLRACKKELGDASIYLFVDGRLFEYIDGELVQLAEIPSPDDPVVHRETQTLADGEALTISKKKIDERSVSMDLIIEMLIDLKEGQIRIEGKIDELLQMTRGIVNQLAEYQTAVSAQLQTATSPEDEEQILHGFSERCVQQINEKFDKRSADKEFNTEREKLKISFKAPAWRKLDTTSRKFLVSSKVMFNNLINLEEVLDYSGVCLLMTKALEVEMTRRFCTNFLAYLEDNYPGKENYDQYPTALLKYGKPIKEKDFTLGSIAYVLCYREENSSISKKEKKHEIELQFQYFREKMPASMSDDEIMDMLEGYARTRSNDANEEAKQKKENNKEKLLEYCRANLFSGKSDGEIMQILNDYAEAIEDIKKKYRNPAAHTNELREINAIECSDLMLDQERLLKKMLDSFDK